MEICIEKQLKELRQLAIDRVIRILQENGVKLRRFDFDNDENDSILGDSENIKYKNCVRVITKENEIIGTIVKVTYTGRWEKQLKQAKKHLLEQKYVSLEEKHIVFGFTIEELKDDKGGQFSLFQLLDENNKINAFSWDSDINEIYDRLVSLVSKYAFETGKKEFSVWEHVPQFGYRMTFTICLYEKDYTRSFLNDLQEVVDFAKSRNVELSPTNGIFYNKESIGNMYIFSTFEDKERRKINKWQNQMVY